MYGPLALQPTGPPYSEQFEKSVYQKEALIRTHKRRPDPTDRNRSKCKLESQAHEQCSITLWLWLDTTDDDRWWPRFAGGRSTEDTYTFVWSSPIRHWTLHSVLGHRYVDSCEDDDDGGSTWSSTDSLTNRTRRTGICLAIIRIIAIRFTPNERKTTAATTVTSLSIPLGLTSSFMRSS